jgi:Flp pilus assembly protein TadG
MLMCSPKRRRRGVSLIEASIVLPIVFFLILALFIGGMGIYRYQEVAHLAREGARYASTHGGQYALDGLPTTTGVPAISSSSDMQTYLSSKTVLLDSTKLTSSVTWTGAGTVTPSNIPSYVDTNPSLVPPGQVVILNKVIVTVSYTWFPEMYLVGPITLSSTSEMPMSY